jgi:hypothetical protein
MAGEPPLDTLRFVDLNVERKSAWGPGEYASRQLEVNGQLLSDYLAARIGAAVEQSTPLVDGRAGVITAGAYLRALLGGPKDDPLREGRVAIGYCDACLDGTCGILLAATLSIEGGQVLWSHIGFEQFEDAPAPKLTPFWKKSAGDAPAVETADPWIPSSFDPDVTLRFDRDAYIETMQSERRRLADGGL